KNRCIGLNIRGFDPSLRQVKQTGRKVKHMANQGPWGGGGKGGGDDGGNDRDKRPSNRPWGEQRPSEGGQKRPGQQGEQMPEIEELMKKGQERLRVLMGGRGGGNGRNGGGGGGPSG